MEIATAANTIPLHHLTGVDVDGHFSHVRCRICDQEYANVMIAARIPCPGFVIA
jgi:hypothetical protein